MLNDANKHLIKYGYLKNFNLKVVGRPQHSITPTWRRLLL